MREMILKTHLLVHAGTVLVASVALGQTVEITEWDVPFSMGRWGELIDKLPAGGHQATRPRDPYVHPDGRVFFCGQKGNYIGVLDPASGQFGRYAVAPGTHPHNLIIDADGLIWYAGNRNSHIGRLDPATGEITRYATPDPGVSDPHTMIWDSRSDIWFTSQGSNGIGKLFTKTGAVQWLTVPTRRARPYGIVMDRAGEQPWIALFGTHKLATVEPATMALTEYRLPRSAARPRRLAVTSDGAVWYVDYAGGRLGRLEPGSGKVQEWTVPGGKGARPYAMCVDDRDRLWFIESRRGEPSRLVGFDSQTHEFGWLTNLASGGGTVRHMVFHAPSREIWFGTDANTIGRARIP